MQESESLRKMLTNLTGIYNEGDTLDVAFGRRSEIRPTGRVIVSTGIGQKYDVDGGANELRFIVDTLSHETEHFRESDLLGKKEFMEEHPDAPLLAGFVNNVLEDAFIDKNRTDRFRGLRKTTAYKSDVIIEDRPSLTELDSKSEQMVEGFIQVSVAGYAKDVDQCDDDVKQFLAFARTQVDDVRSETDFEARTEMSHDVMERFKAACPDVQAAEEYVEEMTLPTDDIPEFTEEELQEWMEEEEEDEDAVDEESAGGQGQNSLDADQMEQLQVSEEEQETFELPGWVKYVAIVAGLAFIGSIAYMALNGMWLLLGVTLLIAAILWWLLRNLFSGSAGASGSSGAAGANSSSQGQGEGEGQGQSQEGSGQPQDGDADGNAEPGEAEVSESSAEIGEDTGNPDAEEFSEEQIQQALEEMERQSESGESREWHNVDSDVDYTEASEEMLERFEQLAEMEDADWGELERQRDEILDQYGDSTQGVESSMQSRGLRDEIEEAFRELKTADRDVAATSGKRINTRNAVRHRAGDMSEDRLYYRRTKAETGDRAIGVAVDLSGSMDRHETRISLAALAQATDIIGDQFLARGYTVSGGMANMASNEGNIALPVITGVDEDFEMDHLNVVQTSGKTPTGAGIRSTRGLLRRASRPEKVLICITDGQPNYTSDLGGGSGAVAESTHEVRKTREQGMKVIGVGVGGVDENTMDQIFDGDYVMVDSDNLADQLVDIYNDQMKVSA